MKPCSSKPKLLGVALLLVSLACAVVSESDDAEIRGLETAVVPRILAESDFSWDTDGWLVEGGQGATQPPRDFAHMGKMIKAGDSGEETWYFVAPQKFIGAKRDAYGGRLCFRHGFYEFNRYRCAALCHRPACLPLCLLPFGGSRAHKCTRTERGEF